MIGENEHGLDLKGSPQPLCVIGERPKDSGSLATKESDSAQMEACILGGAVVGGFLFCYFNVLRILVQQWWTNDVYYYAFLIPLISLYLVWVRRDRLKNLRRRPAYLSGTLVLAVGLLMFLLGNAGSVQAVQELSIIPSLVGIVLLGLGAGFLRVLYFPIAYLLLMIPFWELITDRFHGPFQMFSATLGVRLLQFIGIPVHQQSVFIELPTITLEVAEACSGLNYLIAVMALGIPLAYLFLDGWAKRTTLVCFAVMVATVSNGFRVFLVGALAYWGIGGNIHGPFHVLQALAVSVMGYGAIFVGLRVLDRAPFGSMKKRPDGRLEGIVNPSDGAPVPQNPRLGNLLVVGFLVAAGGYLHLPDRLTPVHLSRNLEELPLNIGRWEGENAAIIGNPYSKLQVDRELSRSYSDPDGRVVHFYVGYFESQRQNKELIHQRSRSYFKNSSTEGVPLQNGKSLEVNRALSENGGLRRLSLYWYDLSDRTVTSPYLAKLYTAWSGLTRGRTNGAVVWVFVDLTDDVSLETASATAREFIRQALPLLTNFLPSHAS